MTRDSDSSEYRSELVRLASKIADTLTGPVNSEDRARQWAANFRVYYRHLAASVEYAKNHPGDNSAWQPVAEDTDKGIKPS